MNVTENIFNLDGRTCKVYSSAGDGSSVRFLIVQAVDKEWIGRERAEEEIPATLGQAVDTRPP